MRAHLAAVHRVHLAHHLLDERVAGLALHRLAAVLLDDLQRVPGQARVVDDAPTREALEEHRRQQADDVVALDEGALLVEEEATVEVAVEGDADVRLLAQHRLGGHRAVFFQHRVRHAVRERAVRLVVQLDELKRQVVLDQVDDQPRPAVARVRDDPDGLEHGPIDVAEQVLAIARADVGLDHRALPGRGAELAALRQLADVLQAGVAADRPGLLAHELHAVVVRRVVAGRDHDPAVEFLRERREINPLGAAQADVEYVHARIGQAADQRLGQFRARQADVAADRDALRLQPFGVGAADGVGRLGVEFLRDAATDVVGLEAVGKVHSRLRLQLQRNRPGWRRSESAVHRHADLQGESRSPREWPLPPSLRWRRSRHSLACRARRPNNHFPIFQSLPRSA